MFAFENERSALQRGHLSIGSHVLIVRLSGVNGLIASLFKVAPALVCPHCLSEKPW